MEMLTNRRFWSSWVFSTNINHLLIIKQRLVSCTWPIDSFISYSVELSGVMGRADGHRVFHIPDSDLTIAPPLPSSLVHVIPPYKLLIWQRNRSSVIESLSLQQALCYLTGNLLCCYVYCLIGIQPSVLCSQILCCSTSTYGPWG